MGSGSEPACGRIICAATVQTWCLIGASIQASNRHVINRGYARAVALRRDIRLGPRQGHQAFTLQTLPAQSEQDPPGERLAKASGFSLHAGVATEPWEQKKLERLCRYITRPALSEQRLSLTSQGLVRYALKTPYRDGTTHVFFEPLDLVARLAALIPNPRVNLIRYHGVFAPNSPLRAQVTPARRGDQEPAQRRAAMTWAQRPKACSTSITRPARRGAAWSRLSPPSTIDELGLYECDGRLWPTAAVPSRLDA